MKPKSAVRAATGAETFASVALDWDVRAEQMTDAYEQGGPYSHDDIEYISDNGGQALAIHGRTRACRYAGDAEYETIAQIKASVEIPVFANGDITSLEKSLEVLRLTNADGLMIGRAAQGRPWIFRDLLNGIRKSTDNARLEKHELRAIILGHLIELHRFYGEQTGVRVARKHLTWYCDNLANAKEFRYRVVRVDSASEQLRLTRQYFDRPDGGISMAA